MRYEIVDPVELGRPRGWNNGMLAPAGGQVLFIAGQTAGHGLDDAPEVGFVEQWARALENVLHVVRESGGGPEHIGRFTIYVTDIEEYRASFKPLADVYRSLMGRHYPAMALVEVRRLVDPNARVEIEATAVI